MNVLFKLLFILVVGLSGYSSLVYQVIWDRLARYNFGGDNTSATIVIAVFLLGLGVGAYAFRKVKSKYLLIYGIVEITIGTFALISFALISNISILLAQLLEITQHNLSSIRPLTVIGCVVFFLPPCILMGGTLPLMFGGFFARQRFSPRELGFVYSVNIFGAVCGAFAVPYFLLNNFSIPTALAFTATINFFIGIIAIILHFSIQEVNPNASLSCNLAQQVKGALSITFITGAATSILEIIFIRHSFDLIPSSPYNFSIVIGIILLSLSMGSLILPSFRRANENPPRFICVLLFTAAIGILATICLSDKIFSIILPSDLEHLRTLIIYFLILCFPVFFPIGGIFPILCSTESTTDLSISSRTGKLYIWNSAGAFVGALFFHYIGIELIGTHGIIILIVTTFSLTALLLNKHRKSNYIALVASTAIIIIAVTLLQTRSFVYGKSIAHADLAFIEEGISGIAAIKWNNAGKGMMMVGGQSMGQLPYEAKHAIQFGVAISAIPEPKNVLVMGLGSGSYVRYLLSLKSVQTITIVDWSNEIPRLLKQPKVIELIGNTLDDPRIKVITGDARLASIVLPLASFDLILDNLVYPTWVGATGVRSSWYFKNISRLLTSSGVYAITTNYARWRNEILMGLQNGFNYVYENHDGYMIIATNKLISKINNETYQEISEKYSTQSTLMPYDFLKVLANGLLLTESITATEPLQEDRLFSEYYYSSKEFLEFLSR